MRLSLGGNIQTVGTKPDGSDWNVAIKDPEHTDQYMGVLKVSNQAGSLPPEVMSAILNRMGKNTGIFWIQRPVIRHRVDCSVLR